MKKIVIRISVITFLLLTSLSPVWSQPLPPPAHGEAGDQPLGGSGAPIGDGMFLLLALSAVYGTRKALKTRHDEDES